jgi:hypothetical protein
MAVNEWRNKITVKIDQIAPIVGLKKSISHKWRNEIPPSTSPRWNTIWHKAKARKRRHSSRRLSIRMWQLTSGMVKPRWISTRFTPLWPLVGGIDGTHVLQLSPCSTRVEIRHQHHLATLYHKKESRPAQVFFSYCNVYLINLCAKHSNGSVAFDSS